MSRSSRSSRSELSPSVTRGGNGGIDLGKNSGIDMGRKSEPSITSGGIGITDEVTNVGGLSVSAGIEVDLTPVDFGVTIDSSEGTVSVAGGAEVPGGLIGISGGIEVDMNTGEITGGSIGGEVGGLGINVSNSKKGGLGIEFTVQIPGTPIELSLGFGFPPKEETTPIPSPTPTPSPSPTPSPDEGIEIPLTNQLLWVPAKFTRLDYDTHGRIESQTTTVPAIANLEKEIEKINNQRLPFDISIIVNQAGYSEYTIFVRKNTLAIKKILFTGDDGDPRFAHPENAAADVNTFLTSRSGAFAGFIDTGIRINKFLAKSRENEARYLRHPDIYTRGSAYSLHYAPIDYVAIGAPSLPPQPFPNPPPRKQKKMDACCRENLKFLRAIYTQLGLFKFPGQLPATIIQEVAKEGEEPAEPPQVQIFTLVDLLQWQFERDDERWGQWQVQINVKDSDITQEGDQSKQVKFPNLAESIAEFEGQLLSIMTNIEALVALQVKTLAESGMARQEAIKGYLAAKAIIKYMAFKSTEIDVPVPMTFTAGAETISALLEESEGHIKGTDYVEKETLRDVYLDLLQAAAIIRAVHWQRIDTKVDTKSQLLSILKGSVKLAATIAKPQKSSENGGEETFNPEEDFEDFIDAVENGFRQATGITDAQNPYGKSPDRRPRIRQIGDNIAQAGGNN